MNHAQLLDCTLRDGAYLVGKKFGDDVIRGIINGLLEAKMDVIEIGFFQDEEFGEGKTVFRNSKDARRFIPDDKKGTMFAVMADYSRFSIENLDECTPDSVDAVRECFFKKERFDALNAFKAIKAKGYKLFVQPVDILGYTDKELIEYIELINEIEPYSLSIVDTFGSMYQEDLHRVFEIINHNLVKTCKIGFHSHNNMQLSNALTQEFIRMSVGKREVVVDATISGMGRGAGNTPTELVAQYMVSQLGYHYNMDAILDVIDGYMDNLRSRCEWGYNTPYFVAGCFSAHVNNIAYLSAKNSIRSKDIRYILNKIGAQARKRYDYDLLERTYQELLQAEVDDKPELERLRKQIGDKPVMIVAPGSSISSHKQEIQQCIKDNQPYVISLGFIPDDIKVDAIWLSNVRRFQQLKESEQFQQLFKIATTNIGIPSTDDTILLSFSHFIKCGWEHMDNSAIMLFRVLDAIGISQVYIAGMDGYSMVGNGTTNYANDAVELASVAKKSSELNDEISEILVDFNKTRQHKATKYQFITPSRFENILK